MKPSRRTKGSVGPSHGEPTGIVAVHSHVRNEWTQEHPRRPALIPSRSAAPRM